MILAFRGLPTGPDLEIGARRPHASTLRLIRTALEAAGIEFIDPNGGGPGLRLRE